MAEHHHPEASGEGGFDRELHLKPILEVGAWTAVLCVVAFIFSFFLYRALVHSEVKSDPAPSPLAEAAEHPLPPEPRLQPIPEKDLAAMRAEEKARLSSYGWVAKQEGIAHVPIERAMALTVEKGLARQQPAP